MDQLGLLALVTQILTEAVARLYPRYTAYVASLCGLLVAYVTNVGLFAALGQPVANHYIDVALAGLVAAGGAGVVQALKRGLTPPKDEQ